MLDTRRRFLRTTAGAAGGAAALLGATSLRGVADALKEPFQFGMQRDAAVVPSRIALERGPVVRDPYASAASLPWWKGQLHTHTARSFDGDPAVDPARRVALYQAIGYDFAILTDHDRVTTVPGGAAADSGGSGRPFLAIPGVESTDGSAHLGVWLMGHQADAAVLDPPMVAAALPPAERIEAWAAAGALVCCNHPSHYSAPLTAEQVESWAGGGAPFGFIEVFNTLATTTPDALAHSLEVWRRAVTAAGPDRPVWAVASDDSHSRGVGRSWIAVAAPALTPAGVRQALLDGRFYASSGLAFSYLGADVEAGGIAASAPGAATVRFVGADGAIRHQTAGDSAVYRPRRGDRWIRVEASTDAGRGAWSQPFWVDA